jgi:hypothetical protein
MPFHGGKAIVEYKKPFIPRLSTKVTKIWRYGITSLFDWDTQINSPLQDSGFFRIQYQA